MSRLTETDVARFVGALRGEAAVERPPVTAREMIGPDAIASDGPDGFDDVARIRGAIASAVEDRSVAPAIDQALGVHLGADIHCATHGEPPTPADPLRFEADGPIALHVDLDAALAAALADVAIGGNGTNTRHGKRALIGRVLERVVLEMMRAIAPMGGLQPPDAVRFIEVGLE